MANKKVSVTSRTNQNENFKAFIESRGIQKLLTQINNAEGKTEAVYIQTAKRLQVLRKSVERRREALGMNWLQFARRCVDIEKNRRGIVMRVMEAKDRKTQEAIVRVYLDGQNARAEKSRANTKALAEAAAKRERKMSKRRRALLVWARKASERKVEKVWSYIGRLGDSIVISNYLPPEKKRKSK